MCPACLRGTTTAGPDVVRGSGSQGPDLQVQRSELIDNSLQRLFHRRRKSFTITLVRDDLGKLRETFASRLRNEAELGKVGSKRIDQLRALAD